MPFAWYSVCVTMNSKGYQLYYGPRSGAEEWFIEMLGVSRTSDTAVVDWLLDVVNTDFEALDGKDQV